MGEEKYRRADWCIYYGILTATFCMVLVMSLSVMGALVATCGAVLTSVHAVSMVRRATPPAQRTPEADQ